MTPTAGPDPSPRSAVWPFFPLPFGGTSIPELLRERLLAAPRQAVRIIHAGTVPDPLLLNTLRAELFLQLGKRTTAAEHANTALQAMQAEQPSDGARLLLVMTVLVDIRCCTGDPLTASDSAALLDLAREEHDQRRAVLAEALRYVALFQHTDCRHGRRLLDELRDQHQREHGETPVTAMLTAGLTSMQQQCAHPPAEAPLRTTPLEAAPGGLLHPDLDHPSADYLASRIAAQPGAHTCWTAIPTTDTTAPSGAGQAPS